MTEETAKPSVREADTWKGSGGTGRFPQQEPAPQLSELEREERRLEKLRLIVSGWQTDDPEDEPPRAA